MDAMYTATNGQKEDSHDRKIVPKDFKLNCKDEILFRQKSDEKSVIMTKVTTYQLKILTLMDDLIHILKKSPSPYVDPIDRFKQRKLFGDFMARFSRNYIYEIDRIIEEIQFYQIDHYSYFERSTNHLINKVCNLFAVIMRGLQVYHKQLAKMNHENSEKLRHFIQLVMSGINVSVELKIFDEDDLLIKLLLEKTHEFVDFLRQGVLDDQPLDNSRHAAKASISAKEICIPTTNRYVMYASKSKKVKRNRTKGSGKCSSNVVVHPQHSGGQHADKGQTMFESQVCSGQSSTCDAYEEPIQQNCMQFNGQESDLNYYTCETETDTEIAAAENALESFMR